MKTIISAERYHDISCGHRVAGHESKCAMLHGHNYRVHFDVQPIINSFAADQAFGLDPVGRVLDFTAIKQRLCAWLEEHWDHRFLAWEEDPVLQAIETMLTEDGRAGLQHAEEIFGQSVVWVPFNPTAENMAEHLLNVIGPQQLEGTGCRLVGVKIEETRKCSAEARHE